MRDKRSVLVVIAVVGCIVVAAVFAGVIHAAGASADGSQKKADLAPQGPTLDLKAGDSTVSVWIASDQVALLLKPGSSLRASTIAKAKQALGTGVRVLSGSTSSVAFVGFDDDGARSLSACALAVKSMASAVAGSGGVRSVSPVLYRGRETEGGRIVLTGRAIVRFTAESSAASRRAVLRSHGLAAGMKPTFSSDIVSVEATSPMESLTLCRRLSSEPAVEWAVPDTWRSMTSASNDPLFAAQWHLKNRGQRGGTPGEDIAIGSVWNAYQGSSSEVVAIVDEATEISHRDLRENVVRGLCWDFVDNDGNPSPASGSDENHGTACAGLAAARGGNGVGVSGVAPKASLAAYRLLGNTTALMIADALTRDGKVIDVRSNSWEPSSEASLQDCGPEVKAALESGVTTGRGGRGCVYVFAAGNGGETSDVNFNGFANSRYVMAVAASDANGQQLSYSETGACVFVNAPSGPGGSGDDCVATAVAPSVGATSVGMDLPFLRQYRDGFLSRSAAGRALTQQYYSLGPELVALSIKSPLFRQRAQRAIVEWLPLFRSLESGDGAAVVSAGQVQALEAFLGMCSAEGGEGLRAAVAEELGRARLDDFTGGPVRDLWTAYEAASRSDSELPGIETTDRTGDAGYSDLSYYDSFNGTSASTPIVAGACALILQANPLLSWRDVRALIAATATQNDPTDASWSTNAAGYHVSNAYGFGRINVSAAVAAARQCTLLGPEVVSQANATPYLSIPDASASGVSSSLTLTDNLTIEDVEVYLTIEHSYWGDLDVSLVSPSGTVSQLARQGSRDDTNSYDNWCLTTVHPFGEPAAGTWRLRVADTASYDTGRIIAWGIKAYGHTGSTVTPPAIAVLKPLSGKRRSAVTITGVGFGVTRASGSVRFGAQRAKCVSWSNNRIKCLVPAGVSPGIKRITVKTALGTSYSKPFRVKR